MIGDISLNQQSLQLMQQQSIRLRAQSKELQLRDDQLKFLKETILALEQQRDGALHHNHQLKIKLKTMAQEIANYNQTVVKQIYQENQQINQEYQKLKAEHAAMAEDRNRLAAQLQELQTQTSANTKHKQGMIVFSKVQLQRELQSARQSLVREQKRAGVLSVQNKQLQIKNITLQRQLEQSSGQINYCSQQIDVLTQKHHDSLRIAQKRLKQNTESMVSKQQYQSLQKEHRQIMGVLKETKAELQVKKKQSEKYRFQLSAARDKLISLELKEDMTSIMLRADLCNLEQSFKIGKRVGEFQSTQHQRFNALYQHYQQHATQTQSHQQHAQLKEKQIKRLTAQLQTVKDQMDLMKGELQEVKQQAIEREAGLQSEYQGRLVEVSVQLKREEVALAGLKHRETQLQQLRQVLQTQGEQLKQERSALTNTLQHLQAQNAQLAVQLTKALELCQTNLWTRQCLSRHKYILQQAIATIHYLYVLLLSQKHNTRRLLIPFIQYYFRMHPALTNHSHRTKRPILKLRRAVLVIVAVGRMRKQGSKGRGLAHHVMCANQRRQRSENMGQHIEQLSKAVTKGSKLNQLLELGRELFVWESRECMLVQLPVSSDLKMLGRVGEIQLD